MDNIYDLLNGIKSAARNVQKSSEPMNIDFAEVVSVKPLKLDFGEFKVSESDELLVISNRIKMLQEGKIKLKFKCNCKNIVNHSPQQGDYETEFELVDDKLKKGDCVICLQESGGEGWVVIDKAEVEE